MDDSKGDVQVAYEIIKDADAPPPPKAATKQSQQTTETVEMLQKLLKGGTGKVPIPQGGTAKGVRIGIGRIASNAGWKDQFMTYEPDPSDGFVYVRKK